MTKKISKGAPRKGRPREGAAKRAKPTACPSCGSDKVLRLVVGYPLSGPPLASDERFSGGCVVLPDQPAWACDDCKHTWGRHFDEEVSK